MDIRQLKYFVSVVDCGSFSEASRRCYLSQSAISQQIKALEDELGTPLLLRSSHRVVTTEGGEMLLPLARKILKDMDECKKRMNDIRNVLCGELRVGLTPTMEAYANRAVLSFTKQYPHIRLYMFYKTIPELIRMLRNDEIDMAFSIMIDGESDWVDSYPVSSNQLMAVMRDTHPLADQGSLTFRQLSTQGIILPEIGREEMNALECYVSKEAEGLHVKAIVDSTSSILNLLRQSKYVSILSEQSVMGEDDLVAIPIAELSHPIITYVHYRRGTYRKRSCEEFLKLMK